MERTNNVISMVEEPPPYLMFSCRLCGNFSPTVVKIFTQEGSINDLGNKINLYIPIKMQPGDGLPDQCCWNCTTIVMTWHNFYETCMTTDQRLMVLKKNTAPTSKLEEPLLNIELVVIKEERPDVEETPTHPAQEETQTKKQKYNLEQPEIHLKPDVKEDIVEESIQQSTEERQSNKTTVPEESLEQKDNEDFLLTSEGENEDDLMETLEDSDNEPLKLKRSKAAASKRNSKGAKVPTCNICNKTFKTRQSLCGHKKNIHEKIRKKRVCCDICGLLVRTCYMKEHLARHSDERPFSCKICGKSFKCKSGLNNHSIVHHTNEKRFKCNVCNKTFRTSWCLKYHQVVHSDQKPFVCKLCDKEMNYKPTWLVHLKQEHKITEKQYENLSSEEVKLMRSEVPASKQYSYSNKALTCHICNIPFKTKKTIRNHMNNVHDDQATTKNSCHICGVFCRKSNMKQHLIKHSDIRPFSCEICGKLFKWASNLRQHKIIIHSGTII